MNTIIPALTIGQTRLLATVIKTTRNMLALAEEEAWDAVADLEVLRREDSHAQRLRLYSSVEQMKGQLPLAFLSPLGVLQDELDVLDYVVDAFFWVDIALSFRTSWLTDEWELETTTTAVCR